MMPAIIIDILFFLNEIKKQHYSIFLEYIVYSNKETKIRRIYIYISEFNFF